VSSQVRRVGVVVPAHNEERLLADCLHALQAAAHLAAVPVTLLVVLDDCSDASPDRCRQLGVHTLTINARNVGVARAAGFQALIGEEADPAGIWLASTDADTRVEPSWLRRQVDLARGGADVVLGVVRLNGNTASTELRQAFDLDYQRQLFPDGSHNHVHGANLGLRASVYLQAGGFPPTPNHEDQCLVQRLRRTPGVIIERTQQLIVSTSGRLDGHCNHGFAATLAGLHPSVSAWT
jgi:glycosyltransferase involved in cell wall biosynthesis